MKLKDIARLFGLIVLLWVSVTITIQRFKCPELTETQLFKRIPHAFVLNWVDCKSSSKFDND